MTNEPSTKLIYIGFTAAELSEMKQSCIIKGMSGSLEHDVCANIITRAVRRQQKKDEKNNGHDLKNK